MTDQERGDSDVQGLYRQLAARMPTHTREMYRGGPKLAYISTEQATTKLNTVLGVDAWSFAIVERWYEESSDCCCVRGILTVQWPSGRTTHHEDVGGQVVNRKKDGNPIEIANDWKGARSDCLKRAAADIGVGLFLYSDDKSGAAPEADPVTITCQDCSQSLKGFRRQDRSIGSPADLATETKRRFGRVLCSACAGKAKPLAAQEAI